MPPPDNYFTVIVQSITELLTRHSDMFVAMGGNLFRGFAIILISWFGAKVALPARTSTTPSTSATSPACCSPSPSASP